MSDEKVVAIKYKCPKCGREHMLGCRGDWFTDEKHYCRWDGWEMWSERVKKKQKAYSEEQKPATGA